MTSRLSLLTKGIHDDYKQHENETMTEAIASVFLLLAAVTLDMNDKFS